MTASNAKPIPDDPHGKLPWWEAVLDALRNRSIEFYPRLIVDGVPQSVASQDILKDVGIAAKEWPQQLDADDLERALKLARESLDEVKAQTEYQDQKSTRLLTVTTFLSALSGALFARFIDTFPLRPLLGTLDARQLLLLPAYLAFSLFALAAVSGALVTFHATRTRFKYPEPHVNDPTKQEDDPKSLLFYEPIIRVSPVAWARAYVGRDEWDGRKRHSIRRDLQQRYLENYVAETYLIAAKTADKLRYLQPAQYLLSIALNCLLVWLVLLLLISSLIAPTKAPVAATEVAIVRSVPIDARLQTRQAAGARGDEKAKRQPSSSPAAPPPNANKPDTNPRNEALDTGTKSK